MTSDGSQPRGEAGTRSIRLVLICGSLRSASVNAAVIRTVAALAPAEVAVDIYGGLGRLPHFNPDEDREGAVLDPEVRELRSRLAKADGVLLCTPEYAGGLPGSFKNLLDWTVGGGETYGKPVAWINASSRLDERAGEGAHKSLRDVLRYTGADIVEPACLRVSVPRSSISAGEVRDQSISEQLSRGVQALTDHIRARTSDRSG